MILLNSKQEVKMPNLKVHFGRLGSFSEIDRFILIPKKYWDDFIPGETKLKIKGEQVSVRIYDIPCDCSIKMHTHRIIDLRDIWEKLQIKNGDEVEVTR